MNFISKSLTRIEWSPFLHSRPSEIPSVKRVNSQQNRISLSAVGKTGNGGKKQRAKAPAKTPDVVAPVKASEVAPLTVVTKTTDNDFARPKEIAYENEVANWVNLIGIVHQPIQYEASSDGKFWAGTVISQRCDSDSSTFWIPVIFEGDLAKIAARYINKADQIHVSGKLFIDTPPPNMTYAQANVQVLVHNLNFVQPSSPPMAVSSSEKDSTSPPMAVSSSETEERGIKKSPGKAKKDTDTVVMDETSDTRNHLLENPTSPPVVVSSSEKDGSGIKKRPGRPKKDIVMDESSDTWNHLLENPTSPPIVVSSSEKEESGIKNRPAKAKDSVFMDETSDTWNHLLENPKEWWDHRENKANGLVKPRHPDFKSKDRSCSLWLNKAPDWVLPKLEGLKFDVLVPKFRAVKQLKGEELWKNLVQNPDKWWDNRIDKRNAKAPDFKHRETGEALWLNESPIWVLSKLPPVKKKQESIV